MECCVSMLLGDEFICIFTSCLVEKLLQFSLHSSSRRVIYFSCFGICVRQEHACNILLIGAEPFDTGISICTWLSKINMNIMLIMFVMHGYWYGILSAPFKPNLNCSTWYQSACRASYIVFFFFDPFFCSKHWGCLCVGVFHIYM